MKITVLGGRGYIGSELFPLLRMRKEEITSLDIGYYNTERNELKGQLVKDLKGDICSVRDLSMAVKGADVVVHLAGLVGDASCSLDKDQTFIVNELSSMLVAEVCEYFKVPRLIYASSCSVYGKGPQVVDEDSPINPLSEYACSKRNSEVILENLYSGSLTILRFATVFGWSPRMRFDLVVNLFTIQAIHEKIVTIHGDGAQFRPFVHVIDVARAIKACIYVPLTVSGVFNVSAENWQLYQLAYLISETYDSELLKDEGSTDERDYAVSNTKFRRATEWAPSIPLPLGFQTMGDKITSSVYHDWKKNPELYSNFECMSAQKGK